MYEGNILHGWETRAGQKSQTEALGLCFPMKLKRGRSVIKSDLPQRHKHWQHVRYFLQITSHNIAMGADHLNVKVANIVRALRQELGEIARPEILF